MDNLEICHDYVEHSTMLNGVKRKMCKFYDINNKGMCKLRSHVSCSVFWTKNGITDEMTIGLIDDFELVFIKRGK